MEVMFVKLQRHSLANSDVVTEANAMFDTPPLTNINNQGVLSVSGERSAGRSSI